MYDKERFIQPRLWPIWKKLNVLSAVELFRKLRGRGSQERCKWFVINIMIISKIMFSPSIVGCSQED